VNDLWTALGLVLVIEGLLYAAFPGPMRSAMRAALALPPATVRLLGLGAAVFGLVWIWLVRG
jgi:uncharacterized protein YjeT (DUF2065 family)